MARHSALFIGGELEVGGDAANPAVHCGRRARARRLLRGVENIISHRNNGDDTVALDMPAMAAAFDAEMI